MKRTIVALRRELLGPSFPDSHALFWSQVCEHTLATAAASRLFRSVAFSDSATTSRRVVISMALLAVHGQNVNAPAADADPAALFKELGINFKLDDKVVKYFVETEKLASLEEFCKIAICDQEISDIIKHIADLERPLQQTSRLRLAWTAVREANDKATVVKMQNAEEQDLDKLLPFR